MLRYIPIMYYRALITRAVKSHSVFLFYIVQGQDIRYASRMVPYNTISFQVTLLGHGHSTHIASQDQVPLHIMDIA